MADYRRNRVAGGTYFFTVALAERGGSLLVDRIDLLRDAVQRTRADRPFAIDAWVVMPDHLHCVWTLPEGDADFSSRWQIIKARFSHGSDVSPARSASKAAKRERGVWQRRFWERTVRDEAEFAACVRYCWLNPVKHGFVARPVDWPWSSFHATVRRGDVTEDWGG